jgi:hypothetical protein
MDINKLLGNLQQPGKADVLKKAAASSDGKRLSQMIDGKEAEAAVKSGDMEAMQNILKKVLSTDEGKRLAKQLDEMMK